MKEQAHTYPWQYLEQEQLLGLRLKDLKIELADTWIVEPIQQLYTELGNKGINFRPHFWISDEWFCPDGIAGIAIPFFILHPRLFKLEKQMMGTVDGKNEKDCMKILRHECAHAFDNAYGPRRLKSRQELFGKASTPYPKSYAPNSKSKNYVRYLDDFYAQSHPDEDWAETFATWLDPNSNWQQKYRNWQCIEKLNLVDRIVRPMGKELKQLQKNNCRTLNQISNINITLNDYYKNKRKLHKLTRRPYFTQESKDFFTIRPTNTSAHHFISNLEKDLRKKLKKTSYEVRPLIKEFKRSSKGLYVKKPTTKIKNDLLEILVSKSDNFYKKGFHRIIM